ncbi:CDP-diacylglycerol--glycerol-3-phosphate 3-phosphatidyltransferase [Streptomyces apricus]|uniref:CDP-diacylglycerol--glycerol-3-phosphate 3-phosphatidyltransferase n=1 Tax=Streptomyces apricus TaxID=1828112 RepID=A0A5A9ZZ27_9ACTN|nr:CDP-diacylglycerol--glycerol-3-phosphate 3-phosphatidyltransferase [Streptomyces apricus]KAA0922251.1 CDP-diacylglycerol--glycerol-3-phosphate 3-phosphatidyltransferase [Streptomyces apricus]
MTGVPASAAGGPGAPGPRGAAGTAGTAPVGTEPGLTAPAGTGPVPAAPAGTGPAPAAPAAGTGTPDTVTSGAGASGAVAPGGPVPKTPLGGTKIGAAAVNQASLWNVANLLTMLRLVLVPGFVALMLADGGYDPAWRAWAWAAFAVAMITDVFDGHLARTYNLVTDFGKIADPIADKAIMGAALICLSYLGDLPWWVTGVILGRELGITLLRFVVIRYGVIPASRGGKLKTLTQGIAVGMYVLALTGPLASLRFWVMAAAVALTVVTGADYVRQAIVLRRRGMAARKAAAREAQA